MPAWVAGLGARAERPAHAQGRVDTVDSLGGGSHPRGGRRWISRARCRAEGRKEYSLSDAQRAWFARARAKGRRCDVANSVEEFVQLVQEHVSGVVMID